MSSSGGGGGGGGGGGPARVTIPETVLKTIQSIREITGKQHSDEDIYSVLRDCCMDPNDTAQKLLYLGIYVYITVYIRIRAFVLSFSMLIRV